MFSFKTHLPLVPHICVSELGQHWFRWWLVACSAPSHYPNQCSLIVNWTLRNKLHWNSNRNCNILIDRNAFENAVCKMATILSRGIWVNIITWVYPLVCGYYYITWIWPVIRVEVFSISKHVNQVNLTFRIGRSSQSFGRFITIDH